MKLKFNDLTLEVQPFGEEEFTSKHTGNPLRRIEVELRLGERDHQLLMKFLGDSDAVAVESDEDQSREWVVRQKTYSYRDGVPAYDHRLELEQKEKLQVEALTVDGLTLHPYEYSERFEDDILFITGKVEISQMEWTKLKTLIPERGRKYFEVIRQGIDSQPREMRFGQTIWSRHNDRIKHGLLLIDKTYDQGPRQPGFFDPEIYRMREELAEDLEAMDALIDTLSTKGVLDKHEVDEIRARAKTRQGERDREFFRVGDIDEFDR